MRLDRLTVKAQEALQDANDMALNYGHQQIEPEHVMLALLKQTEGIVAPVLQKMGVNPARMASALESEIERMPRVSGAGSGQVYISGRLNNLLNRAWKEPKA